MGTSPRSVTGTNLAERKANGPQPAPSRTHVGEGAQGAQEADGDEAEDKELPALGQGLGVLVHHGRDHCLQAPKLPRKHRGEAGERDTANLLPLSPPVLPRIVEAPTVLSSPSVIIIRKKMTAKKVEPTMLAMASG